MKVMGALSLVATFIIVFYLILSLPGMVNVLIALFGIVIGGMGGYSIGTMKKLNS